VHVSSSCIGLGKEWKFFFFLKLIASTPTIRLGTGIPIKFDARKQK
jgi:hypothetical protein